MNLLLDLKSMLTFTTLLKSQSVTTSANGTGIDAKNYIGNITVVANVAAATAGTSPTMDIKIQDSADNSSFADVSGYALTQVTTVDSLQTLNVDTRNIRRYIRAVATIGGTSSPAFPVGVVAIGQKRTV